MYCNKYTGPLIIVDIFKALQFNYLIIQLYPNVTPGIKPLEYNYIVQWHSYKLLMVSFYHYSL